MLCQRLRDVVRFYEAKKKAKINGSFKLGDSKNPVIQQKIFWGMNILRRAKETSSYVNTKLNYHWSGDFKSGETPSGLLRVIRELMWPEAALERAKSALKQYMKSRKGESFTEQQKADMLEERKAVGMRKMTLSRTV